MAEVSKSADDYMAIEHNYALEFQLKGLSIVRQYVQRRLDKSDPEAKFQVYPVWFSKTLHHWKMLASTTLDDQMYYEVTHDGFRNCTYLDAYKKWENVSIPDDDVPQEQKDKDAAKKAPVDFSKVELDVTDYHKHYRKHLPNEAEIRTRFPDIPLTKRQPVDFVFKPAS